MKTAFFRFITWSIVLTSIPALAAERPNLVQNPGFESSTALWRASGGAVTIDTDAHSGSKSLKMVSGSAMAGVYQDIPVTAGKVYSISAWIKQDITQTDAGAATFIYYQYFDTPTWGSSSKILHAQYLEYVRDAGPYKLSGAHTLAPEGAKLVRINLWISHGTSGITGHFDDVSVVEGDYMTNEVNQYTDGGFESGTTGTVAHVDFPGTVFSSVTGNPRSGAKSLKITGNGNWAGVERRFPISAGEGYSFRGYCCMRNTSGGQATGQAYYLLRFRSASGAQVGAWYDFAEKYDSLNYQLMAADMRFPPDGAAYVAVESFITPTSDIGYFDDIQVLRFVKNPNPPGITLRVAPVSYALESGKAGIFDAFGRKLTRSMNGSSVARHGVYFMLLNDHQTKKSVSMSEAR